MIHELVVDSGCLARMRQHVYVCQRQVLGILLKEDMCIDWNVVLMCHLDEGLVNVGLSGAPVPSRSSSHILMKSTRL